MHTFFLKNKKQYKSGTANAVPANFIFRLSAMRDIHLPPHLLNKGRNIG